jgi:hypothetical protein
MASSIIQRFYYKFLRVIYIQLLLFFVYVPILMYWGLPLSIMANMGNIVFLPFLTLFLSFSFIIFFCELLHISPLFIHYLFSKLTLFWITCLSYGSSRWLIGLPFQPILSFFLFFLGGTIILLTHQNKTLPQKVLISFSLLLSIFIILKYNQKPPLYIKIETKNKELTATHINSSLNLVMPSLRLKKNGIAPWFFYEIQPELYKTFGTARINTIVLQNPTKHLIATFLENKDLIEFKNLITVKKSQKNKLSLISLYTA